MANSKFITQLLRLTGMKVVAFWFGDRNRQLCLSVKPFKTGCRCPECGRRGKIKRHMPSARTWRDVCVAGRQVLLYYCPKEITCPTHGRTQEEIPWADPHARITHRLEFLVVVHAQIMTQKAACKLLHLAQSTFSDILHRTIERARDGHKIRGLKTVGVDEISYRRRRKYATIVYDLERSRVIWVGKGKGRESVDQFFEHSLSDYQRKRILWASCDMSEAYIGAIKHHCPNAKLVLDRFHIVKLLQAAVDEVRKQQWRILTGDERKAIKGLRWILYKHPSNRTKEDKDILKQLAKGNRRIMRAITLKDEFERFWTYKTPWGALRFFKRWSTTALKSRLEPIRSFVHTMRKHLPDVITFGESGGLTNAVAEGLNRIIRMVKNRASGFQSFEAFSDLIYLTIGDVDIPAQFPAKERTI